MTVTSHQRLYTSVSFDNVTCLVGRDAGAWLGTSAGEHLFRATHLSVNTPPLGRRRSYKASGERSRRGMPLICGGGPDGGGVSEFEPT